MKQRVVLIGASNLTRSFPLVVNGLSTGLGSSLEIFAAFGHGRSYGKWSELLGRKLPGIIECDLWDSFERVHRSDSAPLAVVLDVGNDLAYGEPVPKLLHWLETCLHRLARRRSEIVLQSLPMESVVRLEPWRFELLRRTLFPAHPIEQAVLVDRLFQVHEGMGLLARRYDARLVPSPGDWYGFDPIHILPAKRPNAWRELFSRWSRWQRDAHLIEPAWSRSWVYRVLRPAKRILFGRSQFTPQPVLTQDNLSISLF